MNRFVFLSGKFYELYPESIYPEIEKKRDRPYVYVATLVNEVQFAVPLRSNIRHTHVLWTDKEHHCGVDFSKAVVIAAPDYIDTKRTPHIRPNEFRTLIGKEYLISQKMASYIRKYKNAKDKLHIQANKDLHDYSTLQYFEEYL